MSEELQILDKNDIRYQILLTNALKNKDVSGLEKARKEQGYEVDFVNPELSTFTSETGIEVAEVAVFKLNKGEKTLGNIIYYKNAKEEGAVSNLQGEGAEQTIAYFENGTLKETKINFENPEESEEVLAKISKGVCVKAVTVICGMGFSGTIPACLEVCAATGPGIIICSALCGILVGGGCWLGAEKVCGMVL